MPQLGEKAIFIEHAVKVTDLDSKDQQAVTVLLLDKAEDIETRAEQAAKDGQHKNPDNVLATTGNALEYEYIGPTGRTVEACWMILKQGWKLTDQLTPSTIDINEYFKFE